MSGYVVRSAMTILRIFAIYRPLRFFLFLSLFFLIPGFGAFARYLFFAIFDSSEGHIQSLVVGAGLIAAGMVMLVGGVLADMIAVNRTILAEIRIRQLEAELRNDISGALALKAAEGAA
jgi:hypothetical protein